LFYGIFQEDGKRGKGWSISMIENSAWVTEGYVKSKKIT